MSGIGDKAALVKNTGFMVLKGDAPIVITLSSGVGSTSADEQARLQEMGKLAASRM